MKPTTENGQQVANRHHTRQTNTQRIRHVLATLFTDGNRRHILAPTTSRERIHVLPPNSQYIPGRR